MSIVGKRVKLEYGDQNDQFEDILPREGKVVSRHRNESVRDWYLVSLDSPFEYDGTINPLVLIRSRWKDRKIGRIGVTSVFLLLIHNEKDVSHPEIDIDNFRHVAWADAKIIKST